VEIDLWDIEGYRHGQPIDQMMWLQENAPVYWHHEYNPSGPGFWAVTKHADIKRIEADGRTFSSEPTTLVDDGNLHGPMDGVHKTLIFEDDPTHRPHREYLGRDLTPKCVRGIESRVERIVTEVIDDVAELGQCDITSDIGGRVAGFVTADLFGLPREFILNIYEIADRINNSADLTTGPGGQAMADMGAVSHQLWEDQRQRPRNDTLISHLVHDSPDHRPQDELQFALDFLVLVDAGMDTTRNIVGSGVQAFFDHPEQRQLLQRDPSLAASATDEVLRYVAPITYQRRTTIVDTEIRGHKIAKGQKVLMWYPAGNRDPEVFANPFDFDITRTPNPHFGFGAGKHFCLGAHLAKLELSLVFRELLRRFPDMEPNGEPVWLKENPIIPPVIVGPRSMPVRFSPARRLLDTRTTSPA
jgi:cytochrome P450